jgi:hypothetical protein
LLQTGTVNYVETPTHGRTLPKSPAGGNRKSAILNLANLGGRDDTAPLPVSARE